ncbi:MAG: hypothetical protein AB7K37_11540 [Cyclobacteriaceae bacterium]
MKKENKTPLAKVSEKMAELINKGQELALKEDRFRSALGARIRVQNKSKRN